MLGALKQKVNSWVIFSNGLLSIDDDNLYWIIFGRLGGAAVDKVVGANPEEIKKRIDGVAESTRVSLA